MLATVLAISNGAMVHESRQLPSWLIFDVGKTSRVHAMSLSPRRARVVNEDVLASRRSALRSAFAHLQRPSEFYWRSLRALEAISSAQRHFLIRRIGHERQR